MASKIQRIVSFIQLFESKRTRSEFLFGLGMTQCALFLKRSNDRRMFRFCLARPIDRKIHEAKQKEEYFQTRQRSNKFKMASSIEIQTLFIFK